MGGSEKQIRSKHSNKQELWSGRLGAAWWHNDKHEGLNIILDGLPPSGRLVMFKHDPDWTPEDKPTAKTMTKSKATVKAG